MRQIAASTMEAEYNALSFAMKDVLPMQELVRTIGAACGIDEDVITNFKTTVYEDNLGALELAIKSPGHHTPRSKSFWTRTHWFRSHLKPNRTTVVHIRSALQKADMLTKGLGPIKFKELRKLFCGW